MNYETIKSFILVVLVGVSLLLSFILWSYQPNYDYFYDASYVNEVDVGGKEKTKNELIEPTDIIFKNGDWIRSFSDPIKMQNLYKDMASWVMYDLKESKAKGRPNKDRFVEIIFPNAIPTELLTNLFTFNQEIDTPDWSFERVFMTLDDNTQSIKISILSLDHRRQLTARIDKSESYHILLSYLTDENEFLREDIMFGSKENPIYVSNEKVTVPRKTVIATNIDPELFINALFRNPSLVTPNIKEAYFTDGQRGMRIVQENLRLEFINPIQANYERLTPVELIDKSVTNINEHKGWTNNFTFDGLNRTTNNIQYRLTYGGYAVFDHNQLSIIEQEWRNQELYKYSRPLIHIGNVLNSEEVELLSGKEIIQLLEKNNRDFKLQNIKDIKVGYFLNYLDDARSLTLEPNWFILYDNEWMQFNVDEYIQGFREGSGD